MLASSNGLAQTIGPERRGLGVKVDGVVRIGETSSEIGAPALDLIGLRQCVQFLRITPHQNGIRIKHVAVGQSNSPLLADGHQRTREVLIGPHAPRDSVHDDTDTLLRHCMLLR